MDCTWFHASITCRVMLSTNFRSCLVLTSGQKPKKMVRAVFEKKYQSIWFWANLETFSRISPYQEFFSKNWLCHFSTFMQKIRKILWTVSEKTAVPTNQPTNQPTNHYQQHRSYRTFLTPVQISQNFWLSDVLGV